MALEELDGIVLDSSVEEAIDEIAHSNKTIADIMRNIALKTKKSLNSK